MNPKRHFGPCFRDRPQLGDRIEKWTPKAAHDEENGESAGMAQASKAGSGSNSRAHVHLGSHRFRREITSTPERMSTPTI
jgi:hypothetical protein